MDQLQKAKRTRTKKIAGKKDAVSITVDQALCELGNKLKEWDGKDFQFVSKPMSNVLKSCKASYEQTSNVSFLLCGVLINFSMSYILTKGIMGSFLRLKSELPKGNLSRLGEEIITLSKLVNQQQEFSSKLLAFLSFIYANNLIPALMPS